MEETLKTIESRLYKSELTFPILKERLLASGQIRAWYRYYRGGNQWAKQFFKEENVFLMDKLIIWNRISENGQMNIHSFKLDEVAKVERDYIFPKKNQEKLILSQVIVTFNAMREKQQRDDLLLKRPKIEEDGDIEGFEKFASLLDF